MTAEHEALVLSLCTRGLMPSRARYALLADLRDYVCVCYETSYVKKYVPTRTASAGIYFNISPYNLENFISIITYWHIYN